MIDSWEFRRVLDSAEELIVLDWLARSSKSGYTRYTSTLVEAWNLAVRGVSTSLAEGLDLLADQPDRLDWPPDPRDPLWMFVVGEARLHRERGVSLGDYLGLMKHIRDAYLGFFPTAFDQEQVNELAEIASRFFDLADVVIAESWTRALDAQGDTDMGTSSVVKELLNEKNLYLTAFESAPVASFVFDGQGKLVHVNHAGALLAGLGTSPGAAYYARGMSPLTVPALDGHVRSFMESGARQALFESEVALADGPPRAYRIGLRRLDDVSGKFEGLVASLNDISDLKEAQYILETAKSQLIEQLEGLPIMVWACDENGSCDYFSGEWLRFTGRTIEQELGSGWAEGVHVDDVEECTSDFFAALGEARPFEIEYRLRRRDGEYRWVLDKARPILDHTGALTGYIGGVIDVTDSRSYQEHLAHLSSHDALTRLPHRRSLEDAMARALHSDDLCGRGHLIFIDVDNFKRVNDTHGHRAGDEVLVAVASAISSGLYGSARAFRLCGDEFVVLLPDCDADDAVAVADELVAIVKALRVPVADPPVSLRVSVGVAPLLGYAPDEALLQADKAMYRAKRKGGGQVVASKQVSTDERERVLSALRQAVSEGKIALEAQHVVDVATGITVYRECFVRLPYSGAHLRPAAFMSAARDAGLGSGLTRAVIRHAVESLARGRDELLAVHLGDHDVLDDGLLLFIERTLHNLDVQPSRLRFELGAQPLLKTVGARLWLSELRSIGCLLAVHRVTENIKGDLLAEIGCCEVKLDGWMVHDARMHHAMRAACEAIIASARAAGALVTACGIEADEDLAVARGLGFDLAQGYFFDRGEILSR